MLIKALQRDINLLSDLSPQEKKMFETEQSIEKLLKNPELEIVMSVKELEQMRKKLDQDTRKESISKNRSVLGIKGKVMMKTSSKLLVENVS